MPSLLPLFLAVPTPLALPAQDGIEFYETKIRPLLHERCAECHGPKKQRSGLRVDSIGDLLYGGERGPAIVPGDLTESLLLVAVRYDDEDLQMPPKSKLSDAEIADLERWVAMGAPAPEGAADGGGEHGAAADEFNLEERAKHWSFQPITDPAVPVVSDAAWPRNDVDRFLLAKLDEAGLAPAHDADAAALIRRLSFDLRGLPPSVAEVEAFVAAAEAGPTAFDAAYAELVDAYLASPDFGETWARHWLDLMRYAESKGHEFDFTLPNAHEYRDYVIRAFDADVPYDRFLIEHIAGDLVSPPRPNKDEGWDESVLGTAWWFLGEEVHSPVDVRADQVERIANQMDVFGKGFLGLTVSCARCHDHKFEPITQKDYYALSGFALGATYRQARFDSVDADARFAAAIARRRDENRAEACRNTAALLMPAARTLAERLLAPDDAMEAELKAAASDPGHPLFFFARTRGLHGAAFTTALANAREDLQVRIGAALGFADERQVLPLLGAGSFGRPGAAPPSFLRGATGEALAARVSLGKVPYLEARLDAPLNWDPAWAGAALAEHVEREPSELTWHQAGRTVRTETVVLEHPKLWYQVRGAGHAFVQVDGHRLLKGPLHGSTRRSWDPDGSDIHWVEHDVSDYVGHRVHVELSPKDGEELAIHQVVSASRPPPAFDASMLARHGRALTATDSAALAQEIEDLAVLDVEALARGEGGPWALDLLESPVLGQLPARAFELPEDLAAILPSDARTAPAASEAGKIDEYLLVRGSPHAPGDTVQQRFLQVLGGMEEAPVPPLRPATMTPGFAVESTRPETAIPSTADGRLGLAGRMVHASNPLVSRVYVNRIWHHLFGRGIVGTTDNLGISGDMPTHPELLDHLATTFQREGWSTKAMIKRLVSTRAYRMASSSNPDVDDHPEEADPTNALLHKANVRRLTAEKIRDGILAMSGGLNRERFGRAVPVHLTPFQDGRGRPQSGPVDGNGRRSIYLSVRRNFLSPLLQAFDYPTPATCRGNRSVSNVPAQALALMNDPFVVGEAKRWGERVAAEDGDDAAKLTGMMLAAWGREPAEAERELLLGYLDERGGAAEGWADVAHVLFNGKEFVYLR